MSNLKTHGTIISGTFLQRQMTRYLCG